MKDRCLFKAKICNGEWVAGFLQCKNDKWYISNKAGSPFAFEVRPDTICQCTGLKDKNGKLIWEGDIILFQRENDDCPFPNKDTKKRLGKVFYKDFRTTFAIEMGKSGSGSLNDDLWKYVQNGNRVEVIGNIFDNPELIKER
ncbi:MAG TPA: hypothetical protein DD446_01715 [Coprococcus sp.]|nr:hypothetical protein [Coprococcus sp.]HBN39555.1 hypothetical protein [Coprococcus sp.]